MGLPGKLRYCDCSKRYRRTADWSCPGQSQRRPACASLWPETPKDWLYEVKRQLGKSSV